MKEAFDVAVLSAVDGEVEGLLPLLEEARSLEALDRSFLAGKVRGKKVLAGSGGLGKVNGAVTAAALLQRFSIREVWHVGCAGAYREGGLSKGDVLVSREVLCGDEGVLTRQGPSSCQTIGIPILDRNGRTYYDRVPVDEGILERVRRWTPDGGYRLLSSGDLEAVSCREEREAEDAFRLAFGPALTVGMASGDEEIARQRFSLHGALAENMEGSGVAQACFRSSVPLVECRGIANMAGDRRKENWDFSKAMRHCHAVVRFWLKRAAGPPGFFRRR